MNIRMTTQLLNMLLATPYMDDTMLYTLSSLIIPQHISKHTGLHNLQNVNKMRFHYNHIPIIYGMVCESTQMIYVGST
jgi:hypothetical protein